MIQPKNLIESLKSRGVALFTGVPDSLLSSLCAYVDDTGSSEDHIITANEGNAVALATGYHLATKRIAMVYMQNSGLGNTINPLTSLADPEVYRIPMVLVIGWRGEPGVKDEPQHVKQGKITIGQLELLKIPYWIIDANTNLDKTLDEMFICIKETNAPVALVVKKDSFETYKAKKIPSDAKLGREEALRYLLSLGKPNDLIVSTTGKTSRELFELRVERGEKQRDFLTVGGMGHTASIALGVALGKPEKRVLCIDGDGSLIMHMGAMPIIGSLKPKNFVHILLNNAAHESVGGQPTVAGKIDFNSSAKAFGYNDYFKADSVDSLKEAWSEIEKVDGPVLLEIKIRTGSRDDLGRPTSTPEQNKFSFMEAVDE